MEECLSSPELRTQSEEFVDRGHLKKELAIPIRSTHIANYFLDKADEDGEKLTMLKLMKLVAIAYGWSLATLDRDILDGEGLEAWKFGPVVTSLYHEFKHYGANPITDRAVQFEIVDVDGSLGTSMFIPHIPKDDKSLQFILDYVWDVYGQYSAFDLVDMTHLSDTPWEKTYDPEERGKRISDDLIKEHYKRIIKNIINRDVESARSGESV